mgnify:CR=1 FL=1
MKRHPAYEFIFDKNVTSKVYETLNLKFDNPDTKAFCYSHIINAIFAHELDLGIDPEKPWEEIIMDNYYQIEYLFVGKITDAFKEISDDSIGITISEEKNFGKSEFKTHNILNLTFLIHKF